MRRDRINSLAELVSPMPEAVFLEHYLNKTVAHIRGGGRAKFKYLLPWRTLNALLDQNSFHDDGIRVMRDGRAVPRFLYRKENRPEYLDVARLKGLCAQGTSIVINFIQKLVPEIGWLAQVVELAVQERVNINAYLSLERGGAFSTHYDGHDVLVLQIHGSKRWQIFDEPEPYPLHETNKAPPSRRNIVFDEILEAGDILYVPRGVYHRAGIEDDDSLHLAVGISTRKGVDFIQWLQGELTVDPLFRQDMPTLRGEDGLAEHERLLKARIREMLDQVSLRDYLRQTDAQRGPLVNFNLGPPEPIADHDELRLLARRLGGNWDSEVEACCPEGVGPLATQILGILRERVSSPYAALKAALPAGVQEGSVRQAVNALILGGLITVLPPVAESVA